MKGRGLLAHQLRAHHVGHRVNVFIARERRQYQGRLDAVVHHTRGGSLRSGYVTLTVAGAVCEVPWYKYLRVFGRTP